MQFYFIRHGQSENNALWLRTGSREGRSADPGLTDVGRRQAEVLARFLRQGNPAVRAADRGAQPPTGFGITHLYTSLMIRAVATGAIVADVLGLPLLPWEDLHENGGLYLKDEETGERIGQAGPNRTYFEVHYSSLVLPESLDEAGWWNRPFEERAQRPVRARRVWRDLSERHGNTEDRVAVIGHGGFYNHLLAALLGMPKRDGYWFALNNAAITRIDFHAQEVVLVYLNRVDFLPRELIA